MEEDEYKEVLDGDRFALDCSRNERLSPKIRGLNFYLVLCKNDNVISSRSKTA